MGAAAAVVVVACVCVRVCSTTTCVCVGVCVVVGGGGGPRRGGVRNRRTLLAGFSSVIAPARGYVACSWDLTYAPGLGAGGPALDLRTSTLGLEPEASTPGARPPRSPPAPLASTSTPPRPPRCPLSRPRCVGPSAPAALPAPGQLAASWACPSGLTALAPLCRRARARPFGASHSHKWRIPKRLAQSTDWTHLLGLITTDGGHMPIASWP